VDSRRHSPAARLRSVIVTPLAVDAITGGLYKLSPEMVTAQLSRGELQTAEGDELLLIMVVLQPEMGMERVGTLVRE